MALPAALLLGLQATVVPSAGIFDVTKYGAKGDATTVDSSAVRAAAAACASAGGGTLLFPAAQGGPQLGVAAPCAASPCPGHPAVNFCPSNPASGQCDAPMPHKPCPPCANPYAGMLRGYVTGAFSHGS